MIKNVFCIRKIQYINIVEYLFLMNNRIIKVTRNSCFFMIIRTMEDIDEKVLEELNKKYSKYELAFAKEILTLLKSWRLFNKV